MHFERSEYNPSEASEGESVEVKNNVVEFLHQGTHAEHAVEHISKEAGLHESPVSLSESELTQAEAELVRLQAQKKQILIDVNKGIRVLGIGNKKAREINKSMSVKNLPEISRKLHKLESDIAFTKASAKMSKEDFDTLKPHERSMQILKEAGYNSIAEARAAHLKSGESQDSKLARMIRIAASTTPREEIVNENNVVYVPKSVWTGTESKDNIGQMPNQESADSEDEFRKLA